MAMEGATERTGMGRKALGESEGSSAPSTANSNGSAGRRYTTYACGIAAVLVLMALFQGFSLAGEMESPAANDLYRRPELTNPPPRIARDSDEGSKTKGQSPGQAVSGTSKAQQDAPKKRTKRPPGLRKRPGSEVDSSDATPWVWENAGGRFGLSCPWEEAVSMPGSGKGHDGTGASLRSEACMTAEKKAEVGSILEKRSRTPEDGKVAACVRTKDFGRFLPEWVAYHYAAGVDEIMVYDDDSVDGTREILDPFIQAGIVKYHKDKLRTRGNQMKPLNDCLNHYLDERKVDAKSPRWLLFHDTDEYLFPVDTSFSMHKAMQPHNETCCLYVNRVQYGSGGHRETPRGLTLDNFVTHAHERASQYNRLPKLVVNVDPSRPDLGVIQPPLPSMHGVKGGCKCDRVSVSELRINHYLGSTGDFMDKTRRYWQENHSVEKVELYMADRDVNTYTSAVITHWSCATREVLARAVEGLDLGTGKPLPTVS